MVQRYLGKFLNRNLEVDQLTFDLIKGNIKIDDLSLNVIAVNEILSNINIPLRLIDGYIGQISIAVPWTSLLAEATRMKIRDLQLTFQTTEVIKLDDKDAINSMVESVVNSLVSSGELARSVMEEAQKDGASDELEDQKSLDSFAKVIDAIYSRFCIDLEGITIRVEQPSKDSSNNLCTAIELRCDRAYFMDEQMKACQQDDQSAEIIKSQPHGIGNITNLNKYIKLEGVKLYTDVFSNIPDVPSNTDTNVLITSMHIRREKMKQQSPSRSPQQSLHPDMYSSVVSNMSAFHSCYQSLVQENALDSSWSPSTLEPLKPTPSEPELFSNPIQFLEVIDPITVVLRLKNAGTVGTSANVDENKVDADFFIKAINIFISPSQIEIINRFVAAIAQPVEHDQREHGKRMVEEDFAVLTKNFEETNTGLGRQQGSSLVGGGGLNSGGNWQQTDDFREFTSVNLDDMRRTDTLKEGYQTLKSNPTSREETNLKFKIGTMMIYVTHCDYLSYHYAKEHGGYFKSITHLYEESTKFFDEVANLNLSTQLDLEMIRDSIDKLYLKDHLRIVGTSITANVISKRTGSSESMISKLIFGKCDIMEYLTKESAPSSETAIFIPILDYRGMENEENDPNFKLVVSRSSENKGKTNIELLIGSCKSEIDMSMIDRIADLIVRTPFFDRTLADFDSRKGIPQLKEDLFTSPVESTKLSSMISIKCKSWLIDLRIPIADLRDPSGSRLPFSQRHLRDEYVQITLKDMDCEIPRDNDETTKINLSCNEITGDFCGENLDIPEYQRRFLYGCRIGLDKVKIHIGIDPRLRRSPSSIHCRMPYDHEDMMKSISTPVIMSQKKQEGPFSKTPRVFNPNGIDSTENIIQAGTREEIITFQNKSFELATTKLIFDVPLLRFHIAEKKYLENLYNRLVNDLALFQPAAPAFRQDDTLKITALDAFQECTAPKNFDSDDSDIEDDQATFGLDNDIFDRSLPHTFCMAVNVTKCTMLCNTIVREKESEIGAGKVALEFDDVQLGTTVGYHGDINHSFFHITSKKTSVGSSNDSESTISHKIESKEFGKWKKDETQMEFVKNDDELSNGSNEDSFAIALHMCYKPENNTKNVLVGVALRNSIVYARPFKDFGHFWVTQLSELFTLVDDEIQGYDLPTVTTDLHVVLENAIAGYDHKWINPNSNMKLRAVFGSCNLSSSVLVDMNLSKSLCILQNAVLYISDDSSAESVKFATTSKSSSKKFVPVVNVEHTQLDVLISLDADIENQERTHPAFEFRCENDIIEIWLCADSLAALATIAFEISQSDKIKPTETECSKETEECNVDDGKSVAGESCWSGTTATKHVHVMTEGSELPDEIGRRIREIMEEATRDEDGVGIAVGTDAVNEFRPDYKPKEEFDDMSFPRDRTYSYPTDEEFCMVDDNILGSGITNVAGEPRVRYCCKNETSKEQNIAVDMNNFGQQEGWRNNTLQQFPSDFAKPILRYLLRDLSFRVHLYSGNDLSAHRPSPKSYSTEEFREGRGKDQVVEPLARGGRYRDHSASVVLELTKITFMKQVFDKSTDVFATTLFSIGDIVIKDCVFASDIKEMLYQFSSTEEPRRSYAPLLSIRMSETPTREGKMRVSMLPMKINIDQDTLEFLIDFYEDISSMINIPQNANVVNSTKHHSIIEVPAEIIAHGIRKPSSSKSKLYPSLPPKLNMEPLTPSPIVAPPTLGDLSYLETREKNIPASPIRNPIIDAPLTASAVSIGNMFETDRSSRNGHLEMFSPQTTPLKSAPTSPFDYTGSDDSDLTSDMSGDWHEKCNINFNDLQNMPTVTKPMRDILSGSTMMGSVHPMIGNLVDTSSDTEDAGNFLDDLNDDSEDKNDADQLDSSSSTRKNSQETAHMLDETEFGRTEIYFKEFVFSPSVKIYIDYHGKRKLSFEKTGPLYGLLMAFGQLNQMPIELREINNTNGILGTGKCFDYALAEWVSDLLTSTSTKTNALASCGPISPFVTIGRGIVDLFWMPVEEMRKENGRVVKGIQRGVGSFGSSSAAGLVGMAQTVTGFVQSIAEMTMMEIQPRDPNKRIKRVSRVQAVNPSDIRHSFQLAYGILYDGYYDAKDDLERAAQEDRALGNSAVRRVFRYAVPTFLGPLVMATKVTYQLLGGVRNQLRPDLYNDERRKWGDGNVPGGAGQR